MEPMNLFSRNADPAGVVRRLREVAPAVWTDGPDHDWRSAEVTIGRWWKKRKLTLVYDPDYHAEPGWTIQMNGMQEHFSRYPDTHRKSRAVMLPTTFRYALSTRFEPDLDSYDDPRLEVLFLIAEHLDGVLFTPSGLRDARGRLLFGAGGAAAEDPHALWPRVIAEVSVAPPDTEEEEEVEEDEDEEDGDEEDLAEPPSAERVARRALALAAVTARAFIERDAAQTGAAAGYRNLLEWVRALGIEDELEEPERTLVFRPLGALEERAQINAVWRLEGLAVLAWALGRFEIPPHDELVDPDALWRSVGLLQADAARALLANPPLRTREEIGALRSRLFALHWRLRDFSLRPTVIDFEEFARTAWFGPLDLTGLTLVEGDLGLQGARLDQAPPEAFSTVGSTALERHQAASWLWEGPELYSEASVAT